MTLKERVIVETYTGYCMTSAEERNEVYKYMEGLLGRPFFTHELANKETVDLLNKKAKADFLALCTPETHTRESKSEGEVIQLEVTDDSPMQIAYAICKFYTGDCYPKESALIMLDELTEHIDAHVRAGREVLKNKKLVENEGRCEEG